MLGLVRDLHTSYTAFYVNFVIVINQKRERSLVQYRSLCSVCYSTVHTSLHLQCKIAVNRDFSTSTPHYAREKRPLPSVCNIYRYIGPEAESNHVTLRIK